VADTRARQVNSMESIRMIGGRICDMCRAVKARQSDEHPRIAIQPN